jgi:tetratricopeptide (TPR) repeat protein
MPLNQRSSAPWPRSLDVAIAGCLLALTLGIYLPVRHFDFVDIDDPTYVPYNQHVMSGLTGSSLKWSFTSTDDANWIPLTRLSLMADQQLYGPNEDVPPGQVIAGPYHWTNVLIHAASAVLLFGILKWLTTLSWPSAFAAFLFALHPQHVESVAWVTERKDVLSAWFWMLTIWSYAAYAKRRNRLGYWRTMLLYLLGFMAKSMVVTLPAVFLLLDLWPLGRLSFPRRQGGESLWGLIREKWPFFMVAAGMSAITVAVQHAGGAVRTFEEVPLPLRLENAVVSAAVYIWKTIWPSGLAVFYPIPAAHLAWQIVAAAAALLGLTVLAIGTIRTRPYLAAGWFWYLITVLPVIGFVQVGAQLRADRYNYLPSIGLSLMLAWSGAEMLRRRPKLRPAAAGVCVAVCLAFAATTWRQISYWQNSRTLYEHAIAATGRNALAHARLGKYWEKQGRVKDAISEYRLSLEISPRAAGLQANLGDLLFLQKMPAAAVEPFTEAVMLQPGDAVYHNRLGTVLAAAGRTPEAIVQFEAAIRIRPDYAEAYIRLGNALTALGRTDEAREQYAKAALLQQTAGEPKEK